MNWVVVGEIVKVLGAVATAAAAWFAAVIAYRGLEKWKSETVGKRRADLAASVLAGVYEAETILRAAREPWVLPHEVAKQEGVPDEIAENSSYVPERRLLEHQEFFARFRSLKHEFAAVFGKNAAKPFDELWRIRIDINHAVDNMLRNKELGKSRDPEDINLWREWYRVAFRDPIEANDELLKRVNAQVTAVEEICRPAIEARNI
ncbi:MAG TPA: hypothetical protein VH678_27510 [Xanthobacteraceae bacterium]|jgi:hypothetical protein